jgi:hypothetical protein
VYMLHQSRRPHMRLRELNSPPPPSHPPTHPTNLCNYIPLTNLVWYVHKHLCFVAQVSSNGIVPLVTRNVQCRYSILKQKSLNGLQGYIKPHLPLSDGVYCNHVGQGNEQYLHAHSSWPPLWLTSPSVIMDNKSTHGECSNYRSSEIKR